MTIIACTIDGCEKRHVAKGMCGMHYSRARAARQETCSVDGCQTKAHSRTYCQAHYRRWADTGSPLGGRKPHLRGYLPEGLIWCASCEELLPKDSFQAAEGRPNGVTSYCKPCGSHLRATKYKKTLRASQKRWMRANPGKSSEYSQRYAEANRDKRTALQARLKAAKPELYAAIARAADSNRRARERNAPGFASAAQTQARWDYFGGKCWMCGDVAVEVDHVKPLAKGGSHWPSNLRPACRLCNSKKRAKWPFPTEVVRRGSEAPQREVATRAA